MSTIKFKRGAESNRGGVTPASGEPLVTTDTKELFIGDGSTPGGIPVGTIKPEGTITAGQVAVFKDSTGTLVKGKSEADIVAGLETTADVDTKLTGKLDKTAKAEDSKHADNSDSLGTRPAADYLNVDLVTQSYQEDDAAKVTSAKGVKALNDKVNALPKVTTGSGAPSGGSHGDLYVQL